MTNRSIHIRHLAAVLLIAAVSGTPAHAAPLTFAGASVMGSGSNGESVGFAYGENSTGPIQNGQGAVDVSTAYLAPGGPNTSPAYLNNAVTPNIAFALSSPGLYAFTLYYAADIASSYRALNLFFGASAAPGISVWTQTGSTVFRADGSGNLVPLSSPNNQFVNGSGTLFFDDGDVTVTLTSLTIYAPYASASPVGSTTLSDPNASTVEAAAFVLTVSANTLVPEPGAIFQMGAAIVGLGVCRRRKSLDLA